MQLSETVLTCLRKAFDDFVSIAVCGGSPDECRHLLEHLLEARTDPEYTVVLVEGFERPGDESLSVVGDMPVDAGLRAALRQDPDCLMVDQRGAAHIDMLSMAMETGQRVIWATPTAPMQAALDELAAVSYSPEAAGASRMLLLELNGGKVAAGQATVLEGRAVVTTLFDGTQATGAAWQGRPPNPFPHMDDSPIEVPPEWPQGPVLPALRQALADKARTAWGPRLDGTPVDLLDSRFGGTPALQTNEEWPACGACGAPMQLVVQFDMRALPDPARAERLFQFFYCISDICSEEAAWEAGGRNRLVRTLPLQGLRAGDPAAGPQPSRYGEARIVGWEPLLEYPHSIERDELGLSLTEPQEWVLDESDDLRQMAEDDETGANLRQRWGQYVSRLELETPDALREAARYGRVHGGDKLLGWPAWTQHVEYPACPQCGERMDLWLQINNDGHDGGEPGDRSFFGQLFAADGNGHVTRCPRHADQWAFAWACG